jgi:SAM-dependent methyltransferase
VSAVSFDRAADCYDATRGLPPAVRDQLADVLADELGGRGTCLEIGVGTGRIALPLHERGAQLVGADIAPAMLARLADNAGGRSPIPLMLADATQLPLPPTSVGTVLASHLLHLVANWRGAVDEAMRVLRPDGVLLVDFGGGAPGPWDEPAKRALNENGVFHIRPGVSSHADVSDYLGKGSAARPLPEVRMTVQRSLAQDLDDWERQLHAWTWPYPAEQMRQACARVRAWAGSQDWPLDRTVELERTIQWWAFQRPARQGQVPHTDKG